MSRFNDIKTEVLNLTLSYSAIVVYLTLRAWSADYTGDRCEERVNPCFSTTGVCQNEAVCVPTLDQHTCQCQPGGGVFLFFLYSQVHSKFKPFSSLLQPR